MCHGQDFQKAVVDHTDLHDAKMIDEGSKDKLFASFQMNSAHTSSCDQHQHLLTSDHGGKGGWRIGRALRILIVLLSCRRIFASDIT